MMDDNVFRSVNGQPMSNGSTPAAVPGLTAGPTGATAGPTGATSGPAQAGPAGASTTPAPAPCRDSHLSVENERVRPQRADGLGQAAVKAGLVACASFGSHLNLFNN